MEQVKNNEVRMEIIDITPEMASEMLERNKNNYRKISYETVRRYSEIMKRGGWRMNSESIKLDRNGNVIDGQHRLAAIVKSGMTIKTAVVYNLDADTADVLDRGRPRTLAQLTRGELNSSEAAIARYLLKVNRHDSVAEDEYLLYAHKIAPLLHVVYSISRCSGSKGWVPGKNAAVGSAVYCALVQGILSLDDATNFNKILNSGLPLDDFNSTAPLMLRRIMTETKTANRTRQAKDASGATGQENAFAYAYAAIKAFASNKDVRRKFDVEKLYPIDIKKEVHEIEERIDFEEIAKKAVAV